MQTEQTTSDGLKRAFVITIAASDIAGKVDSEIQSIAPKVKMPGFRPGKVPANLVKKMHGEQLHAQTLNDLIRSSVEKLVKDEELRPAMQPQVALGEDYEQGKDARVTVELEVLPQVEAPGIEGLTLEKLIVPVTDEQIDGGVAERRGPEQELQGRGQDQESGGRRSAGDRFRRQAGWRGVRGRRGRGCRRW